jgi:hypothetical protein
MIETGPRHPIRRELHGLDTPLLQAGLAGIPGDFVTIGADALLEQLPRDFQRLGVHPIARAALLTF